MDKDRKKRSFIDSKYTLSFAARFSGVALLGFSLFGLSLFLLLNRRLGVNYFEGISVLSDLQDKLPVILLATGIIQAGILSFVLFMLSLLWAHSVAGPMVRFRRFLKMLGERGVGEEIVFRKNDQLHYLAQVFRRMQADLKNRRDKCTDCLDEAEKLVREYEDLIREKDTTSLQLKDKLTALKKAYQNINEFIRSEAQ